MIQRFFTNAEFNWVYSVGERKWQGIGVKPSSNHISWCSVHMHLWESHKIVLGSAAFEMEINERHCTQMHCPHIRKYIARAEEDSHFYSGNTCWNWNEKNHFLISFSSFKKIYSVLLRFHCKWNENENVIICMNNEIKNASQSLPARRDGLNSIQYLMFDNNICSHHQHRHLHHQAVQSQRR